MIKEYIKEADAIDMEVQVGPKGEEDVSVKPEEAVPSAVDLAKKDPNTIVIADVKKDDEVAGEIHEYYVDAADVVKYADLNEKTMLESLNDIIECHEDCDISADNIVLIMSEGTEGYVRNLERNGAACVFFNEASVDDINMEVQVGPNGDEVNVKADPQEANPVDAVKRNYDTVVVAKDGDNFFMDVEDVQKCAELNCESVIETLNGIITVNEDFDMNTENIVVLVNEGADIDTIFALDEAEVIMVVQEAGAKITDLNGLQGFARYLVEICETIAGRFKGDKEIKSKAIENNIKKLDEAISRLEEEYEMSKEKGFAPKLKWAVKTLVAAAPSLVASFISLGISNKAKNAIKAFEYSLAGVPEAQIKKAISASTIGSIVGGVAGTAGSVAINAVAYRREVEFMLHTLKAEKGLLESRLKVAKEREKEGKNTILV